MKRIFTALTAILVLSIVNVKAAMFTPSPLPLQETSQNVVITFNALESGVDGLKGLSTDLYAHLGVCTNKSPNDWSHVVTDWSKNNATNTFKRVSPNTYQLTIGDIRKFFNITDASETVTKICVIARNAAGNVQTSDQCIDVYPAGFHMAVTSNPGNTTINMATDITFNAYLSEAGDITAYVDGTAVKSANNVTSLEFTRNFATPGATNYIKFVATKGGETREATMTVFYIKASEQGNYPGGVPKQGAVKNADGTVTFCLAAPGKSSVVLVGSWDDYATLGKNIMKYQDYNGYRYFWTTVSGLEESTYYMYYYLVDGKYKVGDPYAHLVLDHNSDKWLKNIKDYDTVVFPDCPQYPYSKFDDTFLAVYKSDLDDYNWEVTDFKVSNPNSLVIYEMLIRDYVGTSATADGTYKEAIEKIPELNNLGISAIELLPIMQFDGNNSWGYNTNSYMAPDKAYGSPDDLKRFIDTCHKHGIAVILDIVFNHTPDLHPWYAMYDAGTSPFYNATAPHDYGVYNDIKQEYPLVEQHWVDVLTYWLTAYKVDGFRFDLVKGLGDSNSYKSGTEPYNQSRIDRMKRLHAAMLKVNPNVIHINENLAGAQEETQLGNDGQYQWNNQNGNSIKYASAEGVHLQYYNSKNCSRPVCSTVDYAESHDEQWVAKKATTQTNQKMRRIGSMAAQQMMSPGPKMMWQFGEWGYDLHELTEANRTDPKMTLPSAYFNSPARKGLKQSYSELLWMRRSNPDMFDKDVTIVYSNFGNTNNVRTIRLTKGDKEIIAFINPGNSFQTKATVTATSTVLNANNCQLVSATNGFTNPTLSGTGTSVSVSVPGDSYCIFATKNAAGIDDVITDEVGNNVKVYGSDGRIVIDGDYENARVYNISGMTMPSLNVPAGIYIVDVDGNRTKVLVK